MKTLSLKSKDQLQLHAVKWKIDAAKFNVCLIHGLGEHSERYEHVAAFFNQHKGNVYSMDHRGHGKSEGARGCGPNLDSFLDDIDLLIAHMKEESDLPWIFYAHSMGANLSLNHVIRRKPDCKAIVATSSWITLENTPGAALVLVANLINRFGGFTKDSEIDPAHISTDTKEVDKYKGDPLNHGKISSKAGMALYYSGKYLYDYTGGMKIPTLMMHAKEDKLTLASGSEQFSKNNPENVTLKLWDEVYHEMHNDVKREELFEFTWKWLTEDKKIL